MKTSKFIIAFVVAIAMVFSLTPVVFATNTNTLTSDTTVTLIDGSILSVPEKAITGVFGDGVGSSTYIVHQVQEGFYYRFIIDTFARPAGVAELEILSWRRFVSESVSSLEDALLAATWTYTDFTDVCYDPSTVLSIGRGSVDPVYATFDYCDSFGNVIIADCDGSDFGGDGGGFGEPEFMTITLDDGTKLSVPIALSGTDFFVIAPDNPDKYSPYLIYQFDNIVGVAFGNYCDYTLWSTELNSDGLYCYNGIYAPDVASVLPYRDYTLAYDYFVYQYPDGSIFLLNFRATGLASTWQPKFSIRTVDDVESLHMYCTHPNRFQLIGGSWVKEDTISVNSSSAAYVNIGSYPALLWSNCNIASTSSCDLSVSASSPVVPLTWVSSDVVNVLLTNVGTVVYSTFDIGDHTANEDDSTGDDSGDDTDTGTDTDTSEDELGWLQKIWSAIRNGFASVIARLNTIIKSLENVGGGDSGISIENNTLLDDDDKSPFDEKTYKGIIKTMRRSLDFLFGFFDSASGGLNDFLDQFDDTNSVFFGLFNLPGLGG